VVALEVRAGRFSRTQSHLLRPILLVLAIVTFSAVQPLRRLLTPDIFFEWNDWIKVACSSESY